MALNKKRIRVLFLISDLSGGGAERVASSFLRHLDRNRFEPGLCLWRDERSYPVPEDVPVWVLHKYWPWDLPRTICRTARLVDNWRPDVVFSLLKTVNVVTGLAIAKSGHWPDWFPSYRNDPKSSIPWWSRWLHRLVLGSSKKVICLSEGVRIMCQNLFHLPEDHAVTLYNPLEFEAIDRSIGSPPPAQFKNPTVITVGRLVEQKDHATLLRAFALVQKRIDANLIILGEGPLRQDLTRLAGQLGIGSHVSMPGFVDNPFQWVVQSHVFVFSSVWEGLGNVLIEAMALGIPCISTNCPYGPDEIINETGIGWLVEVGNAEAIADRILWVFSNPAEARQVGAAGSESVRRRFGAGKKTEELERLFLKD